MVINDGTQLLLQSIEYGRPPLHSIRTWWWCKLGHFTCGENTNSKHSYTAAELFKKGTQLQEVAHSQTPSIIDSINGTNKQRCRPNAVLPARRTHSLPCFHDHSKVLTFQLARKFIDHISSEHFVAATCWQTLYLLK